MKNILIFILLFSAPMYARAARHNFSFSLTGSLGLLGEYAEREPSYNSNGEVIRNSIPLPLSIAASGAFGFEFTYTWLAEDLITYGVDAHAGLRLTDMPYFWQGGSYLLQPYVGAAVHFDAYLSNAVFLIDALGGSLSTVHYKGTPRNIGFSIMIILPLGFQVLWKNMRFFLRHEIEMMVTDFSILPPSGLPAALCKAVFLGSTV